MNTKYSLTTLLNNLLKLQNNGYQIITSLSDVVSSNADTVGVDIVDMSGNISTVYVPSYGSLKNQLVTLEQNIKSLSGIGDSNTSIQLSDGTFRKILVSSIQQEASDIQNLSVPTNFNTRENWFFESFLNPLLYISFDLTNQIKYNTEKVEIARYILNLDTPDKLRIFNVNFANKSDIVFSDFVKLLLDNGITYFLDDKVIDMAPRALRYYGKFTVTNIFDDTITSNVNGASLQKRVLRVQLDKLNYNDNQSKFLGTQSLKIGDSLVVNDGLNNTRYSITAIDSSTRTVSVQLIEGFAPIKIGADYLSFYGEAASKVSVDVNIGFNEYDVIFIKPIDPDSKIEAINWSPGVGIYTSNLNIKDPNTGSVTSLSSYYQNEVVDFGAFLYATVKDKTTPSVFGVLPSAPKLDPSNFEVLQVNENLTSSTSLAQLKSLQSNKLNLQSQISASDSAISELQYKIQTTNYSSQKLKDTDNLALTNLITQRTNQSKLFASTIASINSIATSKNTNGIDPEYHVRGFFPLPNPKTSDRTGNQHVVQFLIQYRYVKSDGSANQPQQIPYIDNNGQTVRGTFSSWYQYKTDILPRVINPTTGNSTWATEDIQSADTVNINQIDIPIKQGESVEFRIKSISEAGWPINPLTSDWSEIITVPFPSSLESSSTATSIINQAQIDQITVDIDSTLTNMHLDKVSDYTIIQNGSFYTSDSTHIASGFLTPENVIINLFDKLTSMEAEIASLRSAISQAKGVLSVSIVDDKGQEYKVANNTTVQIFAGNYRDQVASLPIKKGVIITNNYFVKISNTSASVLELYSREFGSRYNTITPTYSGGAGFNISDVDYNKVRRYDFVPIGLSNPSTNDISLYNFVKQIPEQSSQVLGQFINSRYLSINGSQNLYNPINNSSSYSIQNSTQFIPGGSTLPGPAQYISDVEWLPNLSTLIGIIGNGNPTTDFIWKGGMGSTSLISWGSTAVQNNLYKNVFVHSLHPDIPTWISDGNTLASHSSYAPTTAINEVIVPTHVRNSILSSLPIGSTGSNIQTAYFNSSNISSSYPYLTKTGATGMITSKVSFTANDQYLIGPRSVGSYLYLNPNTHADIIVDGNNYDSQKEVQFGPLSAITIPIIFQYRMTDFYGVGTVGLGNIGGDPSLTNLQYSNTIGIDIYSNPINRDVFSFDLNITARYYSTTTVSKDIPSRTFESAIDDLTRSIKISTPSTSRDTLVRQGKLFPFGNYK
jgi:hypothetical protein